MAKNRLKGLENGHSENGNGAVAVASRPGRPPKRLATKDHDLKNSRKVDLPADVSVKESSKTDGVVGKEIRIHNIKTIWTQVTLIGLGGLMTNKFTIEDQDKIEADQCSEERGGKKTKRSMPPRQPKQEFLGHAHICKGAYDLRKADKNLYGFPAIGIKKALAQALYSLGLSSNKIDVIRFLFVHGPYDGLIPILGADQKSACIPEMRRDPVYLKDRMGKTVASLAYRPVFQPWSMRLEIKHLPSILSVESLVNGLKLAGTFIGVGSWTNERSGPMGAFDVAPEVRDLGSKFQPVQHQVEVLTAKDVAGTAKK